ncbi:Lrp/AsnC ligand binding domain-containing protein [Candidatus Woesearchaeota archaeon]|nr:Lrp/AsnC ligand binding domain-containing protein [Candidatus Woesearchaeota archaeon]
MLNKKDLQILASLRKDGRTRLTKISKKIGVPVSTIFNKIKQNRGVLITKSTILLDFNKLGFNTRAQTIFSVDKRQKKGFIEFLVKHPNVNYLSRINNGYDCMAELIFRNLRELEEFLEELETRYNLKKKEVHYIIEDMKREYFLCDPDKVGML